MRLERADAAIVLGLAIAYFGAAKLGLALAVETSQISAVWPPTGLAIAAALHFGPRALPGIFLGALAANATADEPLWVATGIAVGNTLEAWLGAWIVTRISTNNNDVRRALGFLAAAAAAPIVSASIGVACLVAGGVQPNAQFLAHWYTWWVGDALGALVVAPALAQWRAGLPALRGRLAEFGAVVAAAALVCGGVFYRPEMLEIGAYVVFPFVIWAAMRLGVAATALVVLGCDAVAIAATHAGLGPFAGLGPERGLVHLQVFIAVAAASALLLASLAEQRRSAEEALRESDRRKDEFLAMLAHELRNPLAAISNAAQLLDGENATREHTTFPRGVIRRQTAHLARLLDDLLDVGRVITGKIYLRKELMDLAATAESAVHTLRMAGRAGRHDLVVETSTAYVNGDSARMEQVALNLISNALAYTPDGGSVRVSVCREGTDAVLRVSDNGIGLTSEELDRVFDLFVQVRREVQSRGGLGIGLTLARRLVELHDGDLAGASDGPGHGAEFTVRLPAVPAPQLEVARAETATARGGARSVLVIEDNDDTRATLATLLARHGFTVREAADGARGLDLAVEHEPDVCLIDIDLPRMDGYAIARALRSRSSKSLLVALTGYSQPEHERRAEEAGFHAHIVKPASFEKLYEIISGASPRDSCR